MEDVKRYVKYYEYVGEESGHAVFVGEVVPGQVCEIVNPQVVDILENDPNFKSSTEKAYDKWIKEATNA